MLPKVVIAGGMGFLGTLLARRLAACGFEIRILSRTPAPRAFPYPVVPWDGATAGNWIREVEGCHAFINMAGRSVNCRYTRKNRRAIMDSRIIPTRLLGRVLASCENPPRIWLNSSTATIYRHTFGPAWTEAGEIAATREAKDAFSIDVATAWEHEFFSARLPHIRRAALRTAIVFGRHPGTIFPILQTLARCGMGGRMGDGRQWVSWIHQADFARAVEFILARESLSGPINIAAPHAVANAEMMRVFRQAAGGRLGVPAPQWLLEVAAFFHRTETELLIKSRHVAPARLQAAGFEFQFPRFESAIKNLWAQSPQREIKPLIANAN